MHTKPPIAVVGMSGLFPGAPDLKTYWQNIINKKETISEVPDDRWIIPPDTVFSETLVPDKACSRWAGLIHDFKFIPQHAALDERFLAKLDPLYHIVLHTAQNALSLCDISSIDRKNTGVILACIVLPTDTSSFITREILGRSFEETLFPGSSSTDFRALSIHQSLASRITSFPASLTAKAFGLGGGSYTLDAACSSSLYAIKLACDALNSKRADVMLAGGVSRPDSLYTQIGFTQLQALSPSGVCSPFDKTADGLVVGEGAGMLVLKRLNDALRDNDHIFALIRGIGLSNDIEGNLLTPDSEGQVRAMHKAYKQTGWSPFDVDYIECHGTGTPIGDTEELKSLNTLWGNDGWDKGQCAIGSIKSMIGHLLTASSAAGLIKTILALNHRMLPPSLNFSEPPDDSPLINSPFKIQTEPEEWKQRDKHIPRRAAVSAFGFGGINAHLLVEEWLPETKKHFQKSSLTITDQQESTPNVAVIGMDTLFGEIKTLRDFQEVVFNGVNAFQKRPKNRWKGGENISSLFLDNDMPFGNFIDELSILIGEFHIQPNEIPDILPQHLLMLKVAANAMKDAGLPLRKNRPEMGAVIGINFDIEATNYHLRWNMLNLLDKWISENSLKLNANQREEWLEQLRDSSGPPLTSARTLGNLGGIIASRLAREFRLGGPGFVVSCEEASGIKALEIALRSIQNGETDSFIIGAVDLSCDIRNLIASNIIRPYSRKNPSIPFDHSPNSPLPCEGAGAVVLKRLDHAVRDNDRIYAIIKGIGSAGNGAVACGNLSSNKKQAIEETKKSYILSLERAFKDANVPASSISQIETHGSGNQFEDTAEAEALHVFFEKHLRIQEDTLIPLYRQAAIGSIMPNIGHAGAAGSMASFIKTCLSVYHEIIPPLPGFTSPAMKDLWDNNIFYIPKYPSYWLRNSKNGPRRTCIASMTDEGNCAHVILEGYEQKGSKAVLQKVFREHTKPLGLQNAGLFIVHGSNKKNLTENLDHLLQHARKKADIHDSMELTARSWFEKSTPDMSSRYVVSIVASDILNLDKWVEQAKKRVREKTGSQITGPGGVWFSPEPSGISDNVAFVYPGSGNHYVGMGRVTGVQWPELLRNMDHRTDELKTQMIPACYVPWRVTWDSGWEENAHNIIISDPLNMIFGQVVHGGLVTELVNRFGIKPKAVIGYSLGETAGYFATGAWPERGNMLERMKNSNLFKTELAGPCNAARKVWKVPADEDVGWTVAVVNRPADAVKKAVKKLHSVNLLIVNTPDECVIGGRKKQVEAAITRLGCEAFLLEGVVTVHCNAAVPVKKDYKALHLFPVNQPDGIDYYSCARGRIHKLTTDSTASSILNQALFGFDFTETIHQAYKDGYRIFFEMGPHSSCTRMINNILKDKPHLAVSACARGEDDYLTVLKFLAATAAEHIHVDLEKLYGDDEYPPLLLDQAETSKEMHAHSGNKITIVVGSPPPSPEPPLRPATPYMEETKAPFQSQYTDIINNTIDLPDNKSNGQLFVSEKLPGNELSRTMVQCIEATSEAHNAFIDFSTELSDTYAQAFDLQQYLLHQVNIAGTAVHHEERMPESITDDPAFKNRASLPAFSRELCMEFAVGSIAKVLGPEFAPVDEYNVRVRLPDEPLMLVDRIISIEGKKCSMMSGKIVTEHDVLPDAWYLDGGRAPVCISVEAGQADLFLCSFLGIDLQVKGERAYRLLDAEVVFHRELPCPGDVIQYEIKIERFARQGDTYLFFFNFNGYIGDSHLISMTNGCAGFFTEEEVENSGGIILTEEDLRSEPGSKDPGWKDLVSFSRCTMDDTQVDALRQGDLETGFGENFKGIHLPKSITLPGGRMKLIDRVLDIDPQGGRYSMGIIRAEADIHPDDWFLTCHFVDDMVMPGTLMYQCCEHTLRVFSQRLGWVTDKQDVRYEPVIGVKSRLKCRGPVTPETDHVIYEVEIKKIGYNPEPYIIADAHMYTDGNEIVFFKDMSLKLSNITKDEVESFWDKRDKDNNIESVSVGKPTLFSKKQLLDFAVGKPSDAFGELYKVFDNEKVVARLPGPPYLCMDRITLIEPEAWILKASGWIEAEFNIHHDDWFFKANRTNTIPYCIINEIALQPCGWLAAYAGSSLRSEKELKFRNLGGSTTLFHEITAEDSLLTTRSRMTKVSETSDMIIEHFDMEIKQQETTVYKGTSYFGFFTKEALAQQVGIPGANKNAYVPSPGELERSVSCRLEDTAPLSPDDKTVDPVRGAVMPAKAIRMIDDIEVYIPDGGPHGLGFIRGTKEVDPEEWFFKAHFFQDPVCPGSLGLDSFTQLLKFMVMDKWKDLSHSHRFGLLTGHPHSWLYRGQIVQGNKKIVVEAIVKKILEHPYPGIIADGYLKVDGLYIYKMDDFGIQLLPA